MFHANTIFMDRRKFVKSGVQLGLLGGTAALGLPGTGLLYGKSSGNLADPYDLVAVRGGEAEDMFDLAIKSLGGMQAFVKRGQTVVVKPNIGWDTPPERAANTNPKLVGRIVQSCLEAGAKDVFVFDHTCDTWTKCYSNSLIEKYARDAGAKVIAGNAESYYQQVQIPGATRLTSVKVHQLILESDVFINVPVLKHHSSARVTIALKNLMGVVYDRRFWHSNDLHRCIAEFPLFKKPDLNIVDAYLVMKRNGPRGVSTSDVVLTKSLLISRDIVAVDAAAAKIFGVEPETIPHIKLADELGYGTMQLDRLKINRIMV